MKPAALSDTGRGLPLSVWLVRCGNTCNSIYVWGGEWYIINYKHQGLLVVLSVNFSFKMFTWSKEKIAFEAIWLLALNIKKKQY